MDSVGVVLNMISSNDAHRGAAQAVPVARRRVATPTAGSSKRPTRSWKKKLVSCFELNAEVEQKNFELEQARVALEEKAEQLSLTLQV